MKSLGDDQEMISFHLLTIIRRLFSMNMFIEQDPAIEKKIKKYKNLVYHRCIQSIGSWAEDEENGKLFHHPIVRDFLMAY